jgi:hypothetical protein
VGMLNPVTGQTYIFAPQPHRRRRPYCYVITLVLAVAFILCLLVGCQMPLR